MRGQLNYIPQWFYYYGGLADKIEGRVIPIDKPGVFNFTREEPLGVVAAITPWNSPLLLATWKLAPALAAGNTVVWKPSEFSSVSAFAFGELFEKAGFPPGVVNIVTGFGNEVGEPLITHQDVAKVAFTGGDKTGEHVYGLAARGIKHVTLELGGKSANIVFDDADLDQAVKGVVSGIFAATGQTCIAGSRALIHRPIHAEFVERCWIWPRPRAWAIRWTRRRRLAPSPRARNTKRFSITSASRRKKARCAVWAALRRNARNADRAGSWSRPSSPA
jgi:acyl-CoA reductase-like NAD-dependent aldehyde dehydrogenase